MASKFSECEAKRLNVVFGAWKDKKADGITSRDFVKMFKTIHMSPAPFSQPDLDMAFTAAKGKLAKLGFDAFKSACESLCAKRNIAASTLCSKMDTIKQGPTFQNVSEDSKAAPGSGPERFFYDKSTFTGTHQSGGPQAMDAGAGGMRSLCNRDKVQDDALHRSKNGGTAAHK